MEKVCYIATLIGINHRAPIFRSRTFAPAPSAISKLLYSLLTQIVQNYTAQTIAKTLQGWHVSEYNEFTILAEKMIQTVLETFLNPSKSNQYPWNDVTALHDTLLPLTSAYTRYHQRQLSPLLYMYYRVVLNYVS